MAPPVHISAIKLDRFRNYRTLDLRLDRRHVVLTGDNGAGKTNLIEAVSFLTPGRGLRRAQYDAVAMAGGDGTWSVFAELAGAQGPVEIGTGLQRSADGTDTQRQLRIGGAKARSTDELLDHSRIVWLTPAMDGLFPGPAAERRRFVDRLVLAIDPAHGSRVRDFEKSMRSRNRLLAESGPDPSWLDAIEAQLASEAVAIAAARSELVDLLSRLIAAHADPASPFPDAGLRLDGLLEPRAGATPSSELEDDYRAALRDGRYADAAAGRTLAGPHRSDLMVEHQEKSMPAAQCSTGEQKALLVGIVLAHARLVAELHGHAPILLLDEIAAHLDEARRAALFDRIEALGCQAWLTGTDRALFEPMGARANYLHVVAGTVESE